MVIDSPITILIISGFISQSFLVLFPAHKFLSTVIQLASTEYSQLLLISKAFDSPSNLNESLVNVEYSGCDSFITLKYIMSFPSGL